MKTTLIFLLISTTSIQPALASETDLLTALGKNGPDMLCSSEEYRKCLNIDKSVCLAEIKDLHPACLKKAHQNFDSWETDLERASVYAFCISAQHLLLVHIAELAEIKYCNTKENTNMGSIVNAYLKTNRISN